MRIVIAVIATLLFVACTTQPVMNVSDTAYTTNKPNASMDEVRQAIVRAGAGLGWQMTPDKPGHIVGRLALRTHVAVIDIDYTPKTYSIRYKDSTDLNYDGNNIHRNYNGWIQNLDKAIRSQLANL